MKDIVDRAYALLIQIGKLCQPVFLLAIRLYFFWQLLIIGWGKLINHGKVTEYFASLGIPFPGLNVYVVGLTECLGGALILVGLISRLASIPVIVAMIVAYFAGDPQAVASFFSDSDKFVKADPFPFLFSALIIFCFGPGWFSLDNLLKRLWDRRRQYR
ncbi:MAG: DoxX family protein [Verrucomicrobia bacterium]|nr:DoxX family protein [Verrucomicrobiota bacterium]